MISIYYLIRKILQEMGNKKSLQTLENFEDWWK